MNTNTTTSRNTGINIIFELARMKGGNIKNIQQYHSAAQSMQGSQGQKQNLDILKYKPEDKHKYKSHFADHKCGSC